MVTTQPKESLWEKIITEYSAQTGKKREEGNVVILGFGSDGKSSLMAAMQGQEVAELRPSGYGLEYGYVDVKADEEDEEVAKLQLWTVENPSYQVLLEVALNPRSLPHSVVVLTVDLSAPGEAIRRLDQWVDILDRQLDTILQNNPEVASVLTARAECTNEKRSSRLVPLVVVGTKSDELDMISHGDTRSSVTGMSVSSSSSQDPVQLLNFIQAHLRTWCVAHGAASLVYTSAHQRTNIDLLRNHLANVATANTVVSSVPTDTQLSHVAFFVPAGVDTLTDIQNLSIEKVAPEGLDKTPLEKVCKVDMARGGQAEASDQVALTDYQKFLTKQESQVLKRQRDSKLVGADYNIPYSTETTLGARLPVSKPRSPAVTTVTTPTTNAAPSPAVRTPLGSATPSAAYPSGPAGIATDEPIEKAAEKFFSSMLKSYKKK